MLWPDYLTGLPDSHAIIMKTKDIYPKLGRYAISYIRIANLNSYLIKYGSDRHAEIIQWAAAILKTCGDKYNCFVGSTGNHEFVVICKKADVKNFLAEAEKLFVKKAESFYKKGDLNRKSVLSFVSNGRKVTLGLMKLISFTIDGKTDIPREELIPYLESNCHTP
jgi:GGDEF domain-containing protein